MGWRNLWDKISGTFGGGVNVDSLKQACEYACTTQRTYEYCCIERKINYKEEGGVLKSETGKCNTGLIKPADCTIDCSKVVCATAQAQTQTAAEGGGQESIQQLGIVSEFKVFGSSFELIEDCEKGVKERKEKLGIPDKLCYWQEMTKIYAEECKFDASQISEIFEKKAEYRQLNNEDWPSLKTDGDFCVPVIYDCMKWANRNELFSCGIEFYAYGFFYNGEAKDKFFPLLFEKTPSYIYINPFFDFDKDIVQKSFLIHEGLHSIQEITDKKSSGTLLGTAKTSNFLEESPFYKDFPEYIELARKISARNQIQDQLNVLIKAEYKKVRQNTLETESAKCRVISNNDKAMQCYKSMDIKLAKIDVDYAFVRISPESISSINTFYKFVTNPRGDFAKKLKEYTEFTTSSGITTESVEKFYGLYLAYDYVADVKELDPRLSEVHRWWFDQNIKEGQPCEIIDNKERAKIILTQFLNAKDVAPEYAMTQQQLSDVMTVATKKGIANEIYDKLAARLPGLAMKETDGEGAYA
jgi:hypothetical protein